MTAMESTTRAKDKDNKGSSLHPYHVNKIALLQNTIMHSSLYYLGEKNSSTEDLKSCLNLPNPGNMSFACLPRR